MTGPLALARVLDGGDAIGGGGAEDRVVGGEVGLVGLVGLVVGGPDGGV